MSKEHKDMPDTQSPSKTSMFKQDMFVVYQGKPATILRGRQRESGNSYLIAFVDGSGIQTVQEKDLQIVRGQNETDC